MISKKSSIEEKVKLPPTETISRSYHPQKNQKGIRILTVAIYVLCVSLSAIILSLYYIFLWDPQALNANSKLTNCEKIILPEQIVIKLVNSTEITAEEFYKNLLQFYKNSQRNYLKFTLFSNFFLQNKKPTENTNSKSSEFLKTTTYPTTSLYNNFGNLKKKLDPDESVSLLKAIKKISVEEKTDDEDYDSSGNNQ